MNLISKLAVSGLAIFGLIYFTVSPGDPVPAHAMEAITQGADECENTDRCLIVYLSPW